MCFLEREKNSNNYVYAAARLPSMLQVEQHGCQVGHWNAFPCPVGFVFGQLDMNVLVDFSGASRTMQLKVFKGARGRFWKPHWGGGGQSHVFEELQPSEYSPCSPIRIYKTSRDQQRRCLSLNTPN